MQPAVGFAPYSTKAGGFRFSTFSGDNINTLALLHDAPSDVTIMAAAPDGCAVASLERHDLQDCLGDAETILNR